MRDGVTASPNRLGPPVYNNADVAAQLPPVVDGCAKLRGCEKQQLMRLHYRKNALCRELPALHRHVT